MPLFTARPRRSHRMLGGAARKSCRNAIDHEHLPARASISTPGPRLVKEDVVGLCSIWEWRARVPGRGDQGQDDTRARLGLVARGGARRGTGARRLPAAHVRPVRGGRPEPAIRAAGDRHRAGPRPHRPLSRRRPHLRPQRHRLARDAEVPALRDLERDRAIAAHRHGDGHRDLRERHRQRRLPARLCRHRPARDERPTPSSSRATTATPSATATSAPRATPRSRTPRLCPTSCASASPRHCRIRRLSGTGVFLRHLPRLTDAARCGAVRHAPSDVFLRVPAVASDGPCLPQFAIAAAVVPARAQSVPEGQSCGGLLCDIGVLGRKGSPAAAETPAPAPGLDACAAAERPRAARRRRREATPACRRAADAAPRRSSPAAPAPSPVQPAPPPARTAAPPPPVAAAAPRRVFMFQSIDPQLY